MTKNKMGRPQKIGNGRNILYDVLQSLPQDGSLMRFKELREKANMSSATLSKALFYLCSVGKIRRYEVPSKKGRGVAYRIPFDNDLYLFNEMDWLKTARNCLINQKTKPEPITSLPYDFDLDHAIQIHSHVGMIVQTIYKALKCYADSRKNKKDAVLDTHLYLINGLITDIAKELVSEPLGMSDNTYRYCYRSSERLKTARRELFPDLKKVRPDKKQIKSQT